MGGFGSCLFCVTLLGGCIVCPMGLICPVITTTIIEVNDVYSGGVVCTSLFVDLVYRLVI